MTDRPLPCGTAVWELSPEDFNPFQHAFYVCESTVVAPPLAPAISETFLRSSTHPANTWELNPQIGRVNIWEGV